MKRLLMGILAALALWSGAFLAAQIAAESQVISGPAVDNCGSPIADHSAVCLGKTDVMKSLNGGPWQSVSSASQSPAPNGIPGTIACDNLTVGQLSMTGSGQLSWRNAVLSNCH